MSLTVVDAARAAVTDLGRFGQAHLGIQANGAADQLAARTANTLVANEDEAPVVEVTGSTFTARTDRRLLVAVTGAVSAAWIDGVPMPIGAPVLTWPGAEVRLEAPRTGVHSYLAVHGELAGDRFLGSVALDPLVGRGRRLSGGDVVEIAGSAVGEPPYIPVFRLQADLARPASEVTLDVLPGPEADQFPDFLPALSDAVFTVGNQSDQVGTRLEGHAFVRTRTTEILSRGVPMGAVEVPPAGGVIALQRGRPMTAGYPIPAVVARSSHDALAQLRPGDRVHLRVVTAGDSRSALLEQERRLQQLRARCTVMFDACGLFERSSTSSTRTTLPTTV